MLCSPNTSLEIVNGLQVFELVFTGPVILFSANKTAASTALILRQKGECGRLLTAEFSFRYENANEDFKPEVAIGARKFFDGIQRANWARPDAFTKTQFMYGNVR